MPNPSTRQLAEQIADSIRRGDTYRAMVAPSAQQLIDIRWAALLAAKTLGCRTYVLCRPAGSSVLATVTPAPLTHAA